MKMLYSLLLAGLLAGVAAARAEWAQTTGTWGYTNEANWTSAAEVNGIFTNTFAGAQTLTFDGNLALDHGWNFSYLGNFGLTLRGTNANRTITLGGDIVMNVNAGAPAASATQTVTIGSSVANQQLLVGLGADRNITVTDAADTLVFLNTVSGTGYAITKKGAGVLTFSANNTFSGGLIVSNGIVRSTAGGGLGTGAITLAGGRIDLRTANQTYNQSITVNNASTIQWNAASSTATQRFNGNITLDAPLTFIPNAADAGKLYLNGQISGYSNLTLNLNVNNDAQVYLLGTNSGFHGTTFIVGALNNWKYIYIGNDQAFGDGTIQWNNGDNGAMVRINALNGLRTLSNPIVYTNTTARNNWVLASGDLTFLSNVTLRVDGRFNVAAAGSDWRIAGNIGQSGTRSLHKQGPGVLILSGTNTYTGSTYIFAGTVLVESDAPSGSAGAFGNAATAVQLGGNVDNNLDDPDADVKLLTSVSGITIGRSVLVTNRSATQARWTLGGQHATGISTYSGTITLGTNLILQSQSIGPVLANNVTFTGQITDGIKTLSITKVGTGTVNFARLAGNTYDGGTIVSNGTLLVNNTSGSGAGTGAVNLYGGSTLGGTGIIAGTVTVNNGLITPGNSVGTLTVGTLTLTSGASNRLEVAGLGSSDKLVVTGALTWAGQLSIDIAGSGYSYGDSWTLFTFNSQSGTLGGVNLTGTTYVAGLTVNGGYWEGPAGDTQWRFDPSTGVLSVIPEPSAGALVALGLLLGYVSSRRRN